jgi:hypothetical protein
MEAVTTPTSAPKIDKFKEMQSRGGLPTAEHTTDETGRRVYVVLDKAITDHELSGDVSGDRLIPPAAKFKNFCKDEATLILQRNTMDAIELGMTLAIVGPSGISKSFGIENLAAETKTAHYRVNMGANTKVGDLVGRFVPSSIPLRDKFVNLIKQPGMIQTEEGQAIWNKVENIEKRNWTLADCKKLAEYEKIDTSLIEDTAWEWQDGPIPYMMKRGGWLVIDEANLTAILERFNSVFEKNRSLTIAEHLNEIIRAYTPAEAAKFRKTQQELDGVSPLHPEFKIMLLMNPEGFPNRFPFSDALADRPIWVVAPEVGERAFKQYLHFLVSGDQPDVVFDDETYIGDKGLDTKYKQEFNGKPEVTLALDWLAKNMDDLKQLVAKQKLGTKKRMKGGPYIYTRRDLEDFMDIILDGWVMDKPHRKQTAEVRRNKNIRDRFENAYQEVFINTCYDEDQEVLKEIFKVSGVLDYLGTSLNKKTMPAWVDKAKKKGLNVTEGNGTWTFNRTDLSQFQIEEAELIKEMVNEGFEFVDKDGETKGQRKLYNPLRLIEEIQQMVTEPREIPEYLKPLTELLKARKIVTVPEQKKSDRTKE